MDPLLKEIEVLRKHLSKAKEELKQVKAINYELKRENKKQRDILVKLNGLTMRYLHE